MTANEVLYRASNPHTLYIGLSSVFAGTAAAAVHGNLEVLPAVLCVIFVIFGQLASNLCHRYFDDKYEFGENMSDGLYADGERKTTMRVIHEGMMAATIMAAMAGLSIMTMAGWWTLIVALLLVMVLVICNIGPRPISRTPAYLIATFFIFGPIGVIGTSLVQSQHSTDNMLNWFDIAPAVWMSVVIGLMAVNEHLLFNYRSYLDDRRNKRCTFTVRFGRKANRRMFFINGIVFWVVGIGSSAFEQYDDWMIYTILPTISFAVNCYISYKMKNKDEKELLRLQRFCHLNIFFFSVLALILLIILGLPKEGGHQLF